MLDTIKYGAAGLYFEFTWESYVGLAMFVLANVAGTIVFVRFIRVQPLNRQIFFSTIPPTSTFVFLMLFFFTITMREQTDIVTAIRVGLGIGDPTTRYIWIIVIVAVYVLFLYLTYSGLSKPVKKIEKVVEKLRNGKTKTPIKVGNSKQFQEIESDLNQINENYKEQERILQKLMPEHNEISIQNKQVVEKIDLNSSKSKKTHKTK